MQTERSNIKRNRGFTLVEMVIAAAFLAVIGVVLLQLFIHAQNLGLKAHDLDQGVQISKSLLETFKASETPEEFLSDKLFGAASVKESATSASIRLFYDRDWTEIKAAETETDLSKQPSYMVIVEIRALSSGSAEKDTGMTEIRVTVLKNKPYALEKNTKNEIYTVSTIKYFD